MIIIGDNKYIDIEYLPTFILENQNTSCKGTEKVDFRYN